MVLMYCPIVMSSKLRQGQLQRRHHDRISYSLAGGPALTLK